MEDVLDRRVLAIVAVIAVGAAVLMGWWMQPDMGVDVSALPAARPVATAPSPVRPVATRPMRAGNSPVAAEAGTTNPAGARSPELAGSRPPVTPATAEVTQNVEYRCRALGQQAQLVDQLVVIGRGSVIDEYQRKVMVGRVATIASRIFDDAEAMRAGELNCDQISGVNLGHAAEFLAEMRDEVELDESMRVEVDQALAVLDTVDWPDVPAGE